MKKTACKCSGIGSRKPGSKQESGFNRTVKVEDSTCVLNDHKMPYYRILIVDDEPEIRQLNIEVLTDSGYDVEVAEDGSKAWEALQKGTYDLLITDNEMPNMSGIKLLEKLHSNHKSIPAIMATGTMPNDELKREPWFQIVPIVLKPYTLKELLLAVKNTLRSVSRASALF
jgi:CheY-like chemotaxis protein